MALTRILDTDLRTRATCRIRQNRALACSRGQRVPTRKRQSRKGASAKRWSQRVTQGSAALDLEARVFALENPRDIALSLKRSADRSRRRKSAPFRSAMSMLTLYINRAGQHLSAQQRERLEAAKDELRAVYGRPRQNP